jgi:DNA-binding response OmpR family regulator
VIARLLETLMRNSGQIMPTETLVNYVWGAGEGDYLTLKKLVSRLRHNIEPDPSKPVYVETVSGIGYSLMSFTASPQEYP